MSTYLTADRFGTPTNAKKYTIALWFKLSKNTSNHILSYNYGNGQRGFLLSVRSNDQTLRVNDFTAGSTDHVDVRTNRTFRDYSAWYHLVVAYDSTQGTAADRVKIYVNGTQETSMATSTYPSQDLDSFIATTPQNNKGFLVGALYNGSGNIDAGNYFSGYMSQFIFADGTAYAASTFGSTDSNGVWIPNTGPSVTYGTNGFKLDFTDSGSSAAAGNFGSDSSGNNNHFTGNGVGTYANVTDTPQNNFSTMNAAANYYASATFAEGATKLTSQGAAYTYSPNSIGVSAGKWYVEVKIGAGVNNWFGVGIAEGESSNASGVLGRDTYFPAGNEFGQIGWFGHGTDFVYQNNGYYSGSTDDYATDGFTTGDILGLALDADNNTVKFYKNGTVQNGGTAFNLGASSSGFWHFAFGDYDGANAGSHTFQINFGNPAFTIASANSDANGYGKFEYAVPSGHYALCTKNLAQYGG